MTDPGPQIPSLSALAWLAGRWQATVPGLPNDCPVEPQDFTSELDLLAPLGGFLPGIWRVGRESVTLISIREIDGTLEWCQQEFSSGLVPVPNSFPLVLRLHRSEDRGIVFESIGETGHSRVKVMRLELVLLEPNVLVLRFHAQDASGAWITVREAAHRLAARSA